MKRGQIDGQLYRTDAIWLFLYSGFYWRPHLLLHWHRDRRLDAADVPVGYCGDYRFSAPGERPRQLRPAGDSILYLCRHPDEQRRDCHPLNQSGAGDGRTRAGIAGPRQRAGKYDVRLDFRFGGRRGGGGRGNAQPHSDPEGLRPGVLHGG